MSSRNALGVLFVSVLAAATVGRPSAGQAAAATDEGSAVSSPREVLNRFYSERDGLLVVAGDGRTGDLRPMLEESLYRQLMEIRYGEAGEVSRETLAGSAVFMAGTPASNPWIAKLAPELPIEIGESRILFLGETYDQPEDAVFFLHPNPADPSRPLFAVIGNSPSGVERVLSELPLNDHYMVFRGHRRLRFGKFTAANGTAWSVDPGEDRRLRLRESTPRFDVTVEDGTLDAERLARFVSEKEAVFGRVREALGELSARLPRLGYFVYPRLSDKGRFTDDTRIAHTDPEHFETHVAQEEGLEDEAWDTETVALLRSVLGEPRTRTLEIGWAVYLSRHWHRHGWKYWAARHFAAGTVLPLSELLDDALLDPSVYDSASDPETRAYPLRESPLLYEPLAASFVDYLLEEWGRETFFARYSDWRPATEEIGRLEAGWRSHLARLAEARAETIARDRERFPRISGLQKGVNHTFEGFSVSSGYLSRGSDAALAHLRSLHANAVALVPYTYYFRPDGKASPLPFMRGPGKENDESMIHAGLEAKRLGMTVLLKPQIQGRGWPGEITMASPEEWDAFFGYYERWIRHYAILAEMYGFEVLSLGVELVQATAGHEDRWREMASRIRGIYSGELVYSANWGSEFERLGFWDAFDYVGLDSYYPLSGKDDAGDEELVAGARSVVERIAAVQRRFGKPVLLTEVGFGSTNASWKEPWNEPRDPRTEVNLEHQARAFEALFRALEGAAWCRGMYWWKWSSLDVKYRDASHVINGKPAEGVMARWFERL